LNLISGMLKQADIFLFVKFLESKEKICIYYFVIFRGQIDSIFALI